MISRYVDDTFIIVTVDKASVDDMGAILWYYRLASSLEIN